MEKILSLNNFLWVIAVSILLGILLTGDNSRYIKAVDKEMFKSCQSIDASFVRNSCLESIKYNRIKKCHRIESKDKGLSSCLSTVDALYEKNLKISEENFSFIFIWIILGISTITYFTHIRDYSRY